MNKVVECHPIPYVCNKSPVLANPLHRRRSSMSSHTKQVIWQAWFKYIVYFILLALNERPTAPHTLSEYSEFLFKISVSLRYFVNKLRHKQIRGMNWGVILREMVCEMLNFRFYNLDLLIRMLEEGFVIFGTTCNEIKLPNSCDFVLNGWSTCQFIAKQH